VIDIHGKQTRQIDESGTDVQNALPSISRSFGLGPIFPEATWPHANKQQATMTSTDEGIKIEVSEEQPTNTFRRIREGADHTA
jgi:hypothetical protein